MEAHAFRVAARQEARLSCIFFVEGNVAARFGSRELRLQARGPRTPGPQLAALVQDVFEPTMPVPELLDLYPEGRAVSIVAETYGRHAEHQPRPRCRQRRPAAP